MWVPGSPNSFILLAWLWPCCLQVAATIGENSGTLAPCIPTPRSAVLRAQCRGTPVSLGLCPTAVLEALLSQPDGMHAGAQARTPLAGPALGRARARARAGAGVATILSAAWKETSENPLQFTVEIPQENHLFLPQPLTLKKPSS